MSSPGADAEDVAIEAYEAAGYEVYQPPKAKYREQDVFGLFDLLAFGHGQLKAVQVKGQERNRGIVEWFDEATVYEEHLTDLRVEWLLLSDEGIRLYRPTADGYECVFDGREIDETPAPVLARDVL